MVISNENGQEHTKNLLTVSCLKKTDGNIKKLFNRVIVSHLSLIFLCVCRTEAEAEQTSIKKIWAKITT
jgi:hypothetical protein